MAVPVDALLNGGCNRGNETNSLPLITMNSNLFLAFYLPNIDFVFSSDLPSFEFSILELQTMPSNFSNQQPRWDFNGKLQRFHTLRIK